MRKVGIARRAELGAMHSHRINIGTVEKRFVSGRVITADPIDQLELTQKSRMRLGLGGLGDLGRRRARRSRWRKRRSALGRQ
jgi:hypothetical protein